MPGAQQARRLSSIPENIILDEENAMRLLKRFTCKTIGHEPNYFQARFMKNGRRAWKNYARCARCECSDSQKIHTPGLLDLPAWFLLGAADLRFSVIEWHRGKRRSLRRLFRQRTS
jgi:hypothetical protein